MTEYQSQLITLEDIITKQYIFNIPIYQRLYVWTKEQIHILLDDIIAAWQSNENVFYLGGTLVLERQLKEEFHQIKQFDLIDGQQRFTTLWLMSLVLKEALTPYIQIDTDRVKLFRIGFSIRPQVTEFFKKVSSDTSDSLFQLPKSVMPLDDALQEIRAYFDNYSENKILNKKELSEFILKKVQLILTIVPQQTDLNKLFEVINNRGVQLQHHEILKAKLLKYINLQEREAYALLWDACANMNGYVERHLKTIIPKLDTVSLYQNEIEERKGLASAKDVLASVKDVLEKIQKTACNESRVFEGISLEHILSMEIINEKEEGASEELDSESPDRVTSIITFSMLLQHVLRIYLYKRQYSDIERISDKDLLNIFKKSWLSEQQSEEEIKLFLRMLWEIRYQFDKHVIKWIWIEEEKQHAIRSMYISKNNSEKNSEKEYLQRSAKNTSPQFALLQSMLYHSQQLTTHYWLTPLLNFLSEEKSNSKEAIQKATLYLQHLDNHLLCSRASQEGESLIKRTYQFLQEPWYKEKLIDAQESLNKRYDNGTQYPHYWFYKLEYVLCLKHKKEDDFRITSKNSVEHVTPQNPEQKQDELPDEILHNFGNLALVTRNINSEMSNKGFSIKKAEFKHRYQEKGVSLKLEDIFSCNEWKETEIRKHQQKMIDSFQEYMDSVSKQVEQRE